MTKRFRVIAGPNGSGISTLVRRLRDDYAVNFYELLNADDILSEVKSRGAYSPKFPTDSDELLAYALASSYGDDVKSFFSSRAIRIEGDCVRFDPKSVNSYTMALFTNFLQDAAIRRGVSISQETVFSHPSKIEGLRRAREAGYRTYLYFVATCSPEINVDRVVNRSRQGGHDVPAEKIVSRYGRSIAQLSAAIPYLSRAYFFDNSGAEMLYLGQYEEDDGFSFNLPENILPSWFRALPF